MSSSDDELPPEAVPLTVSEPPSGSAKAQQPAEQGQAAAADAAGPPPAAAPVPVTLVSCRRAEWSLQPA